MKIKTETMIGALFVSAGMLAATSSMAEEIDSSLMRGAQLYDKWYAVKGVETKAPETPHPLYPKDGKYADKAGATWRCKECHGWDYMGKDGAYSSGKHSTGIKGINGMKGAEASAIMAVLKSAEHGYGDKLSDAELTNLANFVSMGQIDMDQYIDRANKTPKGDAKKGAAYFNTVCANSHGKDGKQPEEMKTFGRQMGNPWEFMHKVLNGHPGEEMPSLRAFDHQAAADILSHMTTLPKE